MSAGRGAAHGDQGDRRALAAAVTIQGYHRRVVELSLVEFPADDPERARRFWEGLLGVPFPEREEGEGRGRQTREGGVALGLHERGPGPGDRFSLPYFAVADVAEALARVQELGGEVVHPGERWAICRDSEGSPFGLARS
jgi:predicted enzyme related to lactoylglutathione lyase